MGNKQDFSAEKHSLKNKLTAIILLETSKPYKEMDSDLVTECVDFLMELEGKPRLTRAEIEQKVSEIPFKGKVTAINSYAKKKIRAKRIAVIAAVLAVLLAIFSIVAISFTNSEDSLIDRFANYIGEIMNGGEQLEFDNIELIKPNESKTYSSAEELVRDEKISVLFPTRLPENEKITTCWYIDDSTSGKYYIFQCNNSEYGMSVYFETTISDRTKAENPMKKVGDFNVYIINKEGIIQGNFEYKSYFYSVSAHTEEELLMIIENLKEIK